jgi:hypothetical protein
MAAAAVAMVRRILGLLEPLSADRSIVLVGGQAVVFWTRFLGERSSDVAAFTSLVSKDIDFEGSTRCAASGGPPDGTGATREHRRSHAEHGHRVVPRRRWR